MSDVPEPKRCQKCGEPIPAEAPQGLCPKCLFKQACVPTEAGAAESAPPAPEELAAAFPQLEILQLVGQGGMGFVFKARQPTLDRFVALKILPRSLAAAPAFSERFTREARVLARLNHPNIVTIHDFGQAGGFFYLLMEFVDGVNLRQAMQAGRFTPAQALSIVPKICEALQFAHNEGILHRDIKPENILLDSRGRVKIADFGIAKLLGMDVAQGLMPAHAGIPATGEATRSKANLTEAGKVLGTPQYMAPEQLEHPQDVDQRADIYSLGVVFYEMLTGELPLGRFEPPSAKSDVDPRVDQVVLRTLEKERERRYQHVGQVQTEVETIAGGGATPGTAIGSRPKDASPEAFPPASGLPWALIIVAALLIASGCSSVWGIAHGLPRQSYSFDFGVLALPMGIGLLRRRPWWRRVALAFLGINLATGVLVGGMALTGNSTFNSKVEFLGYDVTGPERIWIGGVAYIVVLAFFLWMVRVLLRSDVRALFSRGPFVRPWIEWGALAAALLLGFILAWLLLAVGLDRINSVFTASSFGSATERALLLDRRGRAFLSLSNGEYVTSPEAIDRADWMSQELRDWLAGRQDTDVMATMYQGQPRLAFCNTSCRPVPNRVWDKPWLLDEASVGLLTNHLAAANPVEVVSGNVIPGTFVFHTAHQTAGLLQLLRVTVEPRGVELRYKLVREVAPAPTGPAELPDHSPRTNRSSAALRGVPAP